MSATVAFSTRWRPLLLGVALAVSAAATPLVWAHAARAGHGPMGAPMAGGMGPVLAGPLADDPARLDRWLDRMAQHLQLQPAQRDDIRRIAQAAAQDLRRCATRPAHCTRNAGACGPSPRWTRPRSRRCASAPSPCTNG